MAASGARGRINPLCYRCSRNKALGMTPHRVSDPGHAFVNPQHGDPVQATCAAPCREARTIRVGLILLGISLSSSRLESRAQTRKISLIDYLMRKPHHEPDRYCRH
jgi:hypothetical protein